MRCFDSVVVGASAIGGVTARELAAEGVNTALLEEHAAVGKQRKCTAIVSKKGLDLTGVKYVPSVLNRVFGARVIAGREEFTVRRSDAQALVLDRQAFDEECVREAVEEGAKLFLSTRFLGFSGGRIKTSKGFFTAKTLAGCDGIASSVAASAGLPPVRKVVVGYEAEYSRANIADKKIVDVFLGFPGLFGWVVPCSDEVARVGFATSDAKNFGRYKRKLAELADGVLNGARKKREFTHAIPVEPRGKTQEGNCIVVGDAAGQVKATTGGGIVFGALCAKIAAQEISSFTGGGALDYERRWRAKYGMALRAHGVLRRALDFAGGGLSVGLLRRTRAFKLLELWGDMDFIF